ncbi:low molecular weight protein-tyrosine-phosphatase [uncultured Halovibrio sp.]|uniref:low molecular weight protein-tyrosine-phosphatase n=1 Tax=uncultured Halovibrio sp. TaxID=985049 RepID=UPI0025F62399|nr:low molecular weight protein-tyrosine-phosphatase [uncultured Halovibrio sp.]
MTQPVSILFVCLGNICRSPTAQGVFAKQLQDAGLQDRIRIDSAGTGYWHVGKSPDPRATDAARQRGIDLTDQRARQVSLEDFYTFDHILAMDLANHGDLRAMAPPNADASVELFLSYARHADTQEVPDPYYGGESGFARVLDLITDAGEGLLAELRTRHGL